MSGNSPGAKKAWKDHFLKSGVPLEYEVAAVISQAGMAVEADFSFLRRDVIGVKEWSVDIAANWYGPTEDEVGFNLNALVECKYRSPEKTLLLLEDPNDLYPPATLGGTVLSFDALVPFHLPFNAFVPMERKLQYVYKCIEIYEQGAIQDEFDTVSSSSDTPRRRAYIERWAMLCMRTVRKGTRYSLQIYL